MTESRNELLRSIREPTPEMLAAAAGVGDEDDHLAAVWRAMIDVLVDRGEWVSIPRLSYDQPQG
jgi:hypothetical protein